LRRQGVIATDLGRAVPRGRAAISSVRGQGDGPPRQPITARRAQSRAGTRISAPHGGGPA
jgi:hypothetical protein